MVYTENNPLKLKPMSVSLCCSENWNTLQFPSGINQRFHYFFDQSRGGFPFLLSEAPFSINWQARVISFSNFQTHDLFEDNFWWLQFDGSNKTYLSYALAIEIYFLNLIPILGYFNFLSQLSNLCELSGPEALWTLLNDHKRNWASLFLGKKQKRLNNYICFFLCNIFIESKNSESSFHIFIINFEK